MTARSGVSMPKPTAASIPGLQDHSAGNCGCSRTTNTRNCPYQEFLDGWGFTPDAGNAATRGEIFTPRHIVDEMIIQAGLVPKKAVKEGYYEYSDGTLRKHIQGRVFEPAVGTGNYTATILWHKLQMADRLTGRATRRRNGNKKTKEQLHRYQSYTLAALGNMYFNDIDAGNLQTTKWRLLRDGEIGRKENVAFWVEHVHAGLTTPMPESNLLPGIRDSIESASSTWGAADRDRGVLDVLYEEHTGRDAPDWLRDAWKEVLDANAKLFNGIEDDDTINESTVIPGRRSVTWTFWRFRNTATRIIAHRTMVPLTWQILTGQVREVQAAIKALPYAETSDAGDSLFSATAPDGEQAAQQYRQLTKQLDAIECQIQRVPGPYRDEPLIIERTDA